MFTGVNVPNQNSTSMTGWPMSRSCQSRSCCLLDVLEIVIDSVMDPTFHMTVSHTNQNSTSMTGWPMSRSCQSRSCCLLDVLEIVIDSVMDPTFHVTVSHNAVRGVMNCAKMLFSLWQSVNWKPNKTQTNESQSHQTLCSARCDHWRQHWHARFSLLPLSWKNSSTWPKNVCCGAWLMWTNNPT